MKRIRVAAAARNIPLGTITVTIGMVAGTYLLGRLLYLLRDVVVIVLVAGFLSLLLEPGVRALQRWGVHRRGAAVGVVMFAAFLVLCGLALAFGHPMVNELTRLAKGLPGYVARAEQGKGWIGHLIRQYHLETWVSQNAPKLATLAGDLGRPALALGSGALKALGILVTIFVLTLMLLLEAPAAKTAFLSRVAPARAATYQRIGRRVSRGVVGYMLADFLTSIIAGVVVFITLTALSVPYPYAWALWVALVDFLPTIGGALAGIPTVAFALVRSFTAAAITAAVFLVYMEIENHVLNPMIMSRTVKVSPLVVLLAVLAGAELGDWAGGLLAGVAGALLAVPLAGAAQVLAQELWDARSEAWTPPSEA
jgi:predicted PurR-regulated permease PerM